MSTLPPGPPPSKSFAIAICAQLLLLYSFGIFDHSLWTPDEPRVAAVARSAAEGSWVAPRLNDQPFLEQPPLFYWVVGAFFRLLGWEEPFRARVISTLFCGLGLAFTFCLTRRLSPRDVILPAWLAVWSLALSLEYFHTAHRLVVDSALVCFTTGAAHGALALLQAHSRRRRTLWAIWASVLLAAAFLSKGVIGLAVPALFIAAAFSVAKQSGMRSDATAPPVRFPLELLWIAPLVLASCVGPWVYVLHKQLGSAGLEALLVDNTLARVIPSLAGERAHVRPFYYYLRLPAHLVPALFFLIGGVLHRLSRRARPAAWERQAYDVFLFWAGAGFLMLSLASTKREVYFIPFFPALGGIGGIWLNAYLEGRRGRFETLLPYLLAGFLLLGAIALVVTRVVVPSLPTATILAGAAVTTVFVFWTWSARRPPQRSRMLLVWGGGLVVLTASAFLGIVPAAERMKTLTQISRDIATQVPAGETIYAYDPDETTLGMLALYAGRLVTPIEDAQTLSTLVKGHGPLYVLAVDKTYRRRQRRFEAVEAHAAELLINDERPSSRAFRLYRVSAQP